MRATAKELRFRTKQLLEAVERGEEVLITHRGTPRARLVPVSHAERGEVKARRSLFGIWSDRNDLEDVDAFVDRLRRPRF